MIVTAVKKPATIEAVQYTADNLEAFATTLVTWH